MIFLNKDRFSDRFLYTEEAVFNLDGYKKGVIVYMCSFGVNYAFSMCFTRYFGNNNFYEGVDEK